MDKITYLNPDLINNDSNDPLHSRLLKLINEMKQERGEAEQWIGVINGLVQKGVKGAEIEDSDILNWLRTKAPKTKINKSELLKAIARRMPRIKRVDLARAQYGSWKNIQGTYSERLYVLSSEAMQADDELEDLMYRIEDLGFDPAPMIEDPGIVDRLEAEMAMIKSIRPEMYDFTHHHYSSVMKDHGKNLMAHARVSQSEDLFFVEEIQSDWAQQGRRNDWINGYPKAPFVTSTELWAGVVLRDLMHTAALSNQCQKFAWIQANMRNGGGIGSTAGDDLALFYDSIVKKLAEKAISKAGGRIVPMEVITQKGPRTVLGFEMTPKVREALSQSLPMYSRESILPRSVQLEDPTRFAERTKVVQECTAMLGNAHTIRFVARLYDIAHNNEVPGQYLNKGITLSLRAKNLNRAARHEAWHFAQENFLFPHEKREMRLNFAFGTELNSRTQEVLRAMGEIEAANQCVDDKECAAHAFSLWCEGRLEVDGQPRTLFEQVAKSLSTMVDWLEQKVFGVRVQTPEALFEAMRDGALALRMADNQEVETHSLVQ